MSRELGLAGGKTKGSCSRDHRYSLGVTLQGGNTGHQEGQPGEQGRDSFGTGQEQTWDMLPSLECPQAAKIWVEIPPAPPVGSAL